MKLTVFLAPIQIPVPAADNMALSFCNSLNNAGVFPIHCELLYDAVQHERITSEEDLITPEDEEDPLEDEEDPLELLINSLDELIDEEVAAMREDAAEEQTEGVNS